MRPLEQAEVAALGWVAVATPKGGLAIWENAPFVCGGMPIATFRALAARGLIDVLDARAVISAKGLAFLEEQT